MKRVLVTGASGFVGRHALPALAARGFEVHAVSSRARADGDRAARWHRADLLAPDSAHALIAAIEPTHLLHLAWCATPGRFWTDPDNPRWVESTLRLVREFVAARGTRAVVAGSCAEYDWSAGRCSEGDTPCVPSTLYGVCKHAAHAVAESYCVQAGVGFAWARLFLMFGPGEHPERLVASAIAKLAAGEPFECTEGHQRRDFLYVVDAGDALAALLDSDVEGAVNVASGEATPLRDVIGSIADRLGRADLVRFGARAMPASEPDLLVADVARLEREVGWRARHSLDAAIDETIERWRAAAADRETTTS